MNKYNKDWISITLSQDLKDFNKIADSKDYFIALILQSNPDADIITVGKFVDILSTEFYFKYWKNHELDSFMVQVFNELYEKISPLKNHWPILQDKFSDLNETINETLNTDGSQEKCSTDRPFDEITIKKYLVAVLNQQSVYNKSNSKVETMNKTLLDDLNKILNSPSELTMLRNAVLSLTAYTYSEKEDCRCGYCLKCIKQKFDINSPYYVDLIKKIKDLQDQIWRLQWKNKGKDGDTNIYDVKAPLRIVKGED